MNKDTIKLTWAYLGAFFGIFLLIIMENKIFDFIYWNILPLIAIILTIILFIFYVKNGRN